MSARIFLNSFPKGGTHLVAKLLMALGFSQGPVDITSGMFLRRNMNIAKKLFVELTRGGGFSSETVTVGVDLPISVRRAWLINCLANVKESQFITGHVRYSEQFADILSKMHYRCIQVIRDPRDIVVSHAYYALNEPSHFLHPYYEALKTLDARIAFSIRGGYVKKVGYLDSICARAMSLDGWRRAPGVLTIRFEDLVGEKGGGSKSRQESAILAVCEYLGIDYTGQVQQISDNLFGGTKTFRKGAVGAWKEEFKDEHIKMFNDIAGDLLVSWGYSE